MNDREYAYLSRKIRELLDIDLDAYKTAQMRRRLDSFIQKRGVENAFMFSKKLEHDPELLAALRDMMTINVSEFFRDAEQFSYLASTVLPELLRQRERLNVWTAACSNGQEPYSIAMLLEQQAPGRGHRIFATDFDREVLKRAKAGGPYQASDLRNVSAMQKRSFFTQTDDGPMVVDAIRRKVVFKEHNLLADSFDGGFDLIVCRNVMIYFSNEAKERLFHQFHQSLKPSGVLFVGATESLIGSEQYNFSRLYANFYRKAETSAVQSERRLAA